MYIGCTHVCIVVGMYVSVLLHMDTQDLCQGRSDSLSPYLLSRDLAIKSRAHQYAGSS